jgi:endonuclease YncB( thermonuclease family)
VNETRDGQSAPLRRRARHAAVARRAWIVALVLLVAVLRGADANAAELRGRVIGVRDGDTIDLVTPSNERVRVRLFAIDAPEHGQAYGNAAKRALADLVFNRSVLVEWTTRDSYGRIVGKVLVHGTDVNLRMVALGLAWHYKAYAGEQSAADRRRYAAAEASARSRRIGLWRDPAPVAPWSYRHGTSAWLRHSTAAWHGLARGNLPHVKYGSARRG